MVEYGAFSHKIDYVKFLGDYKSKSASKSHYWFKSYWDFAELVDLACWRSCIGKGLRAACKAGLFRFALSCYVCKSRSRNRRGNRIKRICMSMSRCRITTRRSCKMTRSRRRRGSSSSSSSRSNLGLVYCSACIFCLVDYKVN